MMSAMVLPGDVIFRACIILQAGVWCNPPPPQDLCESGTGATCTATTFVVEYKSNPAVPVVPVVKF